MPEWTCGRCTFINHELMQNCEMCDAPREAAEISYLGDQEQSNSSAVNSSTKSDNTADDTAMDHETSHMPSVDEMLNGQNEMKAVDNIPEHNVQTSVTSSLGGAAGGSDNVVESSKLPEPITPVVLHSMETEETNQPVMQTTSESAEPPASHSPDIAMGEEENGWSFLDNEIRLVLIGKTGVGKSTTGNNILGNKVFKSSASGSSITKKCQLGWANRFKRDIQIIDTPGLFDTGMSNEDISREIVKCIGMTSPGPHAFVLVIRLDRFTAEEKATVDHFINIFGKDMLKYLLVLFTRMDDLKYDGTTLDEYVQNVPPDLKNLLAACQNRRIGFDNRASEEERNWDVQELLKMVDDMVKKNGGGHYTNEMYEETERIIAEQEEERMKNNREQMQMEIKRLREEVDEELRRKEEEQRKDLEKMKGRMTELGIGEDDDDWVEVFGNTSITPVETEMKSLGTQVTQNTVDAESTIPSHTVVKERQDGAENGSSSIQSAPNTGSISVDGSSKVDETVAHASGASASLIQEPEKRSINRNIPSTSIREESTRGSFTSDVPAESLDRKSEYDLEVQRLKERANRLNEEHEREKRRMREDYMARQSAAFEKYNRQHMENRQRTREEMHNVKSNMFIRVCGAIKKAFLKVTSPISRGFQSLFCAVHNRPPPTSETSIF